MEIAIHGSYYAKNFGDTLIISMIFNWVKEFDDSIIINLPYINSKEEADQISSGRSYVIDPSLKNSSALIFSPGGYFGEPNFGFLKRNYWYIRNYRRHLIWNSILYNQKIPFGIVGLGVGPISNSFVRKSVVTLFQKAIFFSVRDNESFDYLKKWGVNQGNGTVTADVALTTVSNGNQQVSTTKKRMIIHFPGDRIFKSSKQKDFSDAIIALEDEFQIVFLEDGKGQIDSSSPNSIFSYLRGILKSKVENCYYKNPDQVIADLDSADVILTSKLHVGILGYSLLKPVVSLPLHQKTVRFYKQIGREKYCIEGNEWGSNTLEAALRECAVDRITTNRLFSNSKLNRDLVFKFLERVLSEKNDKS